MCYSAWWSPNFGRTGAKSINTHARRRWRQRDLGLVLCYFLYCCFKRAPFPRCCRADMANSTATVAVLTTFNDYQIEMGWSDGSSIKPEISQRAHWISHTAVGWPWVGAKGARVAANIHSNTSIKTSQQQSQLNTRRVETVGTGGWVVNTQEARRLVA